MTLSVREFVQDNSRSEILRAAANCFMQRGYTASSIDDVARSLGATKGMIYHHYPSKAHMFADVFRVGMEMNFAAIEPCRSLPGPAAERWRKMALVHVIQMIKTKPFQRVVWEGVSMYLRGATTPEQRTAFEQLLDYRRTYGCIFRDTIAQARDEGDFHFDNIKLMEQVMFLTLNSPLFWYSPRPGETEADIRGIAFQVVTFAFRGLGGKEEEAAA